MARKKHAAKRKNTWLTSRLWIVLAIVLVAAIVVGAVALVLSGKGIGNKGPNTTTTTQTTTTGPREPKLIATATVGSSGDVMIHNGVRKSAQTANGFDFTYCFENLMPYVQKADYAAANIEFSVATGTNYSSLPFRVPASVVTALAKTGYDLGVTANNHIGDGGSTGLKKTLETLTAEGMDHTVTRLNSTDKRYLVKDINGIKIGFLNYSYSGGSNRFSYDNLSAFYTDVETLMNDMHAEGAELVYLYIHWGDEYFVKPNNQQKEMAQKLCALGVDVIIGGHPHKIQPLELITDETTGNKTICLYSAGNLLSGQQIECMSGGTRANSPHRFQDPPSAGCNYPDVPERDKDTHRLEHGENCNDNGHTEDGLIFYVTAGRYEDGTVMITGVDAVPVWCMGRGIKLNKVDARNTYFDKYILVPLEKGQDWKTKFGLSDFENTEAGYSYDRTMKLVGDGMASINADCTARLDKFIAEFKQAQLTTTTTAQG